MDNRVFRWKIVLTFLPVTILVVANAAEGSLWVRGCSPIQLLTIFSSATSSWAECQQIPLLSDPPSMTLLLTTTAATLSYILLSRRWRSFDEDLVNRELIPSAIPTDLPGHNSRLYSQDPDLRWVWLQNAALAIFSAFSAVLFYGIVAKNGYLFSDYAGSLGQSDQKSVEIIARGWWASSDVQPKVGFSLFGFQMWLWNGFRATLWQAIGAWGMFIGLKAFLLNRIFNAKMNKLLTTKRTPTNHPLLQPSPFFKEPDGGWGIFTHVYDLAAWGAVLSIANFSAIIYLAHQQEAWNEVNIILALFVIAYLLNAIRANWTFHVLVKETYHDTKAAALLTLERKYKLLRARGESVVVRVVVDPQTHNEIVELVGPVNLDRGALAAAEQLESEIKYIQGNFILPRSNAFFRILKVPAAMLAVLAFIEGIGPIFK